MYDCVCDCTILPIILPTQSDAFIFFFLLYTLYVNFHSELGLLLKKRGFYLTVDVVIQQTNIWKIFRFGFKLYVRALLYQLKLIFFTQFCYCLQHDIWWTRNCQKYYYYFLFLKASVCLSYYMNVDFITYVYW